MSAKKASKKKAAVKKTAKKAVKKTAPKKAAAKKPAAKKNTPKKAVKKVAKKITKTPVKKTASAKPGTKKATKTSVKKTPAKKTTTRKQAAEEAVDTKTKELVLSARKRTSTPAVFKQRKSKNTPVVFTMEDVEEMLKTRKPGTEEKASAAKKTAKKAAAKKAAPKKNDNIKIENRNHAAASLTDILGFNPNDKKAAQSRDKVPPKWSKYYKTLLELRDHVNDGLQLHTSETLKRSNKEDAGDLSGYGQHMADAGTDTFERDFALSMVSSEQEALYEIEEAIQRIFDGTYGVCEITGEAIAKDRLLAVPFTRYSLEGQRELEKQRRNKVQRVGVLSEDVDETLTFSDDVDEN